ncbi:hypothetical protein [Labrys sp. 22185]|uniref:hypothetical protein n=1 Tax=Labrys sp. 22185 TaxID=3453888 RepID=UPI003F85D556
MKSERITRRTFDFAPCIWCGAKEYTPSLEHILPDSMDCPPGFTLDNDMCASCNNKLAPLDRALLRPFELITFLGKVPRKGGKHPSLNSLASLQGRYTNTGPEIHLNGGPGITTAFGQTLKPLTATKELDDVSFDTHGELATLRFSLPFGDDPKFTRALYKVGFETAVFWLGPESAHIPALTAVRRFVRKGRGAFHAVMIARPDSRAHHFEPPHRSKDTGHLAVGMRIFGVDFVVDFDPQQRLIATVRRKLEEGRAKNWTVISPKK